MALSISTEAWRQEECPKCNAKPGEHCRMPSGRMCMYTHGLRQKKLIDRVGIAPFMMTVQ